MPSPFPKLKIVRVLFNFFIPLQVLEDDEDVDEETAEELQNQMEQDYDIGSTVRDKIIPHALSWFTGEDVQDDDFQELMGDDGGEDDDGEDNNEEDADDEKDDDDEEDDSKPKKNVLV